MIALIGFALSAMVHVAALNGTDIAGRFPAVWVLHVGIFVVFVPFVFATRRRASHSSSFHFFELLPRWVTFAGAVLFAYAAVNFGVFMLRSEGGSPAIKNGRYVLLNHGRLIREISAPEYTDFRANEVRGFSGHWLFFYFIPFAYFAFAQRPNKAPEPTPGSVTPRATSGSSK